MEDPNQLVAVEDREEATLADARAIEPRHVLCELRTVAQEPSHALRERWKALEDVGLEGVDGEERDEPDHRPHLHGSAGAVREMQDIVEEAVLVVPEADAISRLVVDGVRDEEEVLEELRRYILVAVVLLRELERDCEQVQAVHAHPARRVGLLEEASGGERRVRAIEDADVVETEEAAFEDVVPCGVLAIHPPREIEHQLVKHALEEVAVRAAGIPPIDLVHAQRRPRVDGRVHVAELPLVGRELAVRVHVPFTREERELLLGEIGIDQRERDGVKCEIPCGIPGVLPLVGDGEDLAVVEVAPLVIPSPPPLVGRRREGDVAPKPAVHVEVVELLGPEETGHGLAIDRSLLPGELARHHRVVELVGLGDSPEKRGVVVRERVGQLLVGQAEAEDGFLSMRELQAVPACGLRPLEEGVRRGRVAPADALVEGILHVRRRVRRAPDELGVRVVLREEEIARALGEEPAVAEVRLRELDDAEAGRARERGQGRPVRLALHPAPRVAKPDGGENIDCRLRPAVRDRHEYPHVLDTRLRVLHVDVEVPAPEDAGVLDLGLARVAARRPRHRPQLRVRKRGVRVSVAGAAVRVGRCRVQVEVPLLHVLPVVAFWPRQPEEALLQERVPAVPERDGKIDEPAVVAEPEQAVVTPAVRARPRLLIGEVAPRVAVRRVVLANCAPLPLREVRPPPSPFLAGAHLVQPGVLRGALASGHGGGIVHVRDARVALESSA